LFREIVTKLRRYAIVETGTFRGTTTEFMAQSALPVYIIEADPRNFGFVRVRFWRMLNITFICGEGRMALRELLRDDLRTRTLFFYLDAHWNDDLPLAEEVDLVFSQCPLAVIMIDDLQVPSDPGYEYDDDGAGKALIPSYIASPIKAYNLHGFIPPHRQLRKAACAAAVSFSRDRLLQRRP
jgi:hypothetical protein